MISIIVSKIMYSEFYSAFIRKNPSPFSLSNESITEKVCSGYVSSKDIIILSSVFFPTQGIIIIGNIIHNIRKESN